MIGFASALEEIVPNSILFTVVLKPKIDFVQEIITEWAGETDLQVTNWKSYKTLKNWNGVSGKFRFTFNRQIEVCTRGHCYNEQWYLCRKGIITASKTHEVITKMKKVRKGVEGVVTFGHLKKKFLEWHLSIQTSQL